jgi:hypothetical protein
VSISGLQKQVQKLAEEVAIHNVETQIQNAAQELK